MTGARAVVIAILVLTIGGLLYWEYHNTLFAFIIAAVSFDAGCVWKQGVETDTVLYLASFMYAINAWLYYLYMHDKFIVISIVAITQMSDIYQYIVGYYIGRTRIGWISRNKTYEGYVGGLVLTFLTFCYFYSLEYILEIYLLGIAGGLLSSTFKRNIGIKDYSNLLGPHGGWIDRTDSIVLPAIFAMMLY